MNEHVCLSQAIHCIHVAVRHTEPFIPKVHTRAHTALGDVALRTNMSLERRKGVGRLGDSNSDG